MLLSSNGTLRLHGPAAELFRNGLSFWDIYDIEDNRGLLFHEVNVCNG
jgi:hypothetical protein